MFLKQSLSTRKLDEILASRPTVINHLVSYLEKRESYNELTDLLTRTGRYDDAGLVHYNQALNQKSIDDRAICICSSTHQHSKTLSDFDGAGNVVLLELFPFQRARKSALFSGSLEEDAQIE